MATTTSEPGKAELAINWIAHGVLRVNLDPRAQGVTVPAYLKRQHSIVLEWGFHMPKPIFDLKIDTEAISGTLSFPVGWCPCIVPWSAVFAMSCRELDIGRMWINDAPAEVQREILARVGKRANAQVKAQRKQVRGMKGHLRIVKKETGT